MLSVYSWNVNGIRAVLQKKLFEPFMAKQHPDIVCLQEVKAQYDQAQLMIPSYQTLWYSAKKPGYSGTAILTKPEPLQTTNGLPINIIKKYKVEGDIYGDPNDEGRLLSVEYEKFWLVNVYTPNAKDDLSRLQIRYKHWDPAVLEYCQELQKSKPVIYCGDLNVAHTPDDLANPKPNEGKKGFTQEERQGFQNFIDAGFIDTLRLFKKGNGYYTWWSHFANSRARNVGWRIDYILVSNTLKDKVKEASIYPKIMGSDHCPISVTLDI